jgi:uncharacterized protein YcgI (DUF1989 family)
VKLARGEHLRLTDIEGGQTGDLMAFSPDRRERELSRQSALGVARARHRAGQPAGCF